MSAARRATLEDKKALVDRVDCFIFDCDGERSVPPAHGTSCQPRCPRSQHLLPCAGVVWRGDSVIEGVPETLDMLRAMVSHCCCAACLATAHVQTARPHLASPLITPVPFPNAK